jgi:abnormal spindle-like microcephaly-associated protein
LATDLRDGIRLCRLVEILTKNWTISKVLSSSTSSLSISLIYFFFGRFLFLQSLRCPPDSRLQKIHNVEVTLKAIREYGLSIGNIRGGAITAKDIVDGHREKTLALLWGLIIHWKVTPMIDIPTLNQEIQSLLAFAPSANELLQVSEKKKNLFSFLNSFRFFFFLGAPPE